MGVEVRAIDGAAFGGIVTGVDASQVDDVVADQLRAASRNHHGVLCFRFDEPLTVEEMNALTAVFGENEFAPGMITGIGKGRVEGERERSIDEQIADLRTKGIDPYLMFLGNVDPHTGDRREVNAKFFGEWEWHSDMSYISTPPTFSLLHARQVPAEGGDTGFCSQVLAAQSLPAELRARVEGRDIKHDSTYSSNGIIRPGMVVPATPVDAIGEVHPILRQIPGTDQEALFLGRRTNGYISGLPLDESELLLDELWAHATQPAFTYRHHWSVGEVVVWDNRVVMHRRHPVSADEIRFMWRTQTRGEAVVAA
jgi:taurine dioxygenase